MENTTLTSTPSLTEFNPHIIPYQYQVIKGIRKDYDYKLGVHELLLSGSVGSAKSILMAHLASTHCLLYPYARCCLGRQAMPDLKDTIFNKILEHLEGSLVRDRDYIVRETNAYIGFLNGKNGGVGSEIISRSWSDKRYTKARSLELSMLVIEELTENSSKEFLAFYKEYRARVGRLPHVPENIVIAATNPDSPGHAAYDYFINKGNEYKKLSKKVGEIPTRHVYYSITTDNPFLPPWYIEQLKETYTDKECRRMIYGEWVELAKDTIYYAFDENLSVIESHEINENYPICLTYDFNIGVGKPMSVALYQRIEGVFIFFDEIVVQGTRTEDTLDEAYGRGLLHYDTNYVIRGDAAGKHNDTRTKQTDYSIIEKFLANCPNKTGSTGIDFEIDVAFSNPPVRTRHIKVNGALKNAKGETKIKIVKKKCPTIIKGFKFTKLKENGNYIEDDSDEFQHITTAIGYAILRELDNEGSKNRISIRKG